MPRFKKQPTTIQLPIHQYLSKNTVAQRNAQAKEIRAYKKASDTYAKAIMDEYTKILPDGKKFVYRKPKNGFHVHDLLDHKKYAEIALGKGVIFDSTYNKKLDLIHAGHTGHHIAPYYTAKPSANIHEIKKMMADKATYASLIETIADLEETLAQKKSHMKALADKLGIDTLDL